MGPQNFTLKFISFLKTSKSYFDLHFSMQFTSTLIYCLIVSTLYVPDGFFSVAGLFFTADAEGVALEIR